MASTILELGLPSSLTLTVSLFPLTSDTASASAKTLTERTNAKGWYSATITEALAGEYRFVVFSGSTVISKGLCYLEDDTGTWREITESEVRTIAQSKTDADNLGSACSNYSATRGLAGTALPAVAAGASGGVPLGDSNSRVDVGSWLGTAVTVSAATAKPEVDTYSISNDATAANNAESMFDGTGYAGGTTKLQVQLADSVTHGGSGAVILLKRATLLAADGSYALKIAATNGSSGSALEIFTSNTSKPGVSITSNNGAGVEIIAGAVSGDFDGVSISGSGTGSDINLAGSGTISGNLDGDVTGNVDGNVVGSVASVLDTIADSGTVNADGTETTTFFKTNLTIPAINAWIDLQCVFTSGNLAGQARVISTCAITGGVLAFDEGFTSAPANGDAFDIVSRHVHSVGRLGTSIWTSDVSGISIPNPGGYIKAIGTPADTDIATDIANVQADTTTLLARITSTLFSGITSLAQWLGAMAGKQAADSTAQTEIRATGAASGTFDATTDSQEAIRDRGDVAWVTATGFSTFDPTSDVVAHVTLVDTTTTNTDMLTAAAVRSEMDSNSTQLAAIVGDTNELQGDWTNGGRLDLILDELTTQGDTNQSKIDVIDGIVDDILVDTGTTIPAFITSEISDALIVDTLIDGKTIQQALRYIAATTSGVRSGVGTATETFKGLDGATDRVESTIDASSNRTAVSYDP